GWMEVREGMSKVVLTLGPGHTLRDAATRMTEKGVGAAVVIDEEYPGPRIISERDILNSLGQGQDPDAERVGDHMSDTLITAAPARRRARWARECRVRRPSGDVQDGDEETEPEEEQGDAANHQSSRQVPLGEPTIHARSSIRPTGPRPSRRTGGPGRRGMRG